MTGGNLIGSEPIEKELGKDRALEGVEFALVRGDGVKVGDDLRFTARAANLECC